MYNLVDPTDNHLLDQAHELVDLFRKLDAYTAVRRPVVITDESGEVRAGNMLGWHWAGKTLPEMGQII